MKNINLVLLLLVSALLPVDFATAAKPDDMDIVTVCKELCPDAKNNAETHECVERKAKIRKSVKQSKCWEENEKYEKLVAETKAAK